MASLPVYFEQRLVGTVTVDSGGPSFTYASGWLGLKGAFPISITMPLKSERFTSDTFLPWAANLLPESEQLRTLGQLLGMARSDVIGLLTAIGGDTAGALSFNQAGRASSVQWRPVGKPEELESLIEDLPNKPFLVGEEGVSMSLAGVQSKIAVAIDDDDRICIPMNGSPSTHILKPDSPRLPGGVQNEAFCLTLAKRMGIPTPEVTTGRAGNRTYLLVKRYDRTDVGGRCRRLHQEDYCQALGRPPSAKYESNQTGTRGPTLKDMFDITRRHMSPVEIVRLLDMVLLNVVACNSDAHAKNYSIMIGAANASLAPMYDIMCGEVWENVTKNFAQKIAGINRGDHLRRTHWQQFARECGLNPRQVIDRVCVLAKSAIAQADSAASEVATMPAGTHAILEQTKQAVQRRARRLLTQLQELEDEVTFKVFDEEAPSNASRVIL
ncbi:MAG: type II toxin-antitoxin system HipA family toxin [Xanthobacteraceae bacterium]